MNDLKELEARYPLPEGWALEVAVNDSFSLDGLTISRAGLIATHPEKGMVTGSAADLEGAHARAYFELLERTAIVEAGTQANVGTAEWRVSRSNGVALNVDLERAKASARLELIERDAILRSWYGNASPVAIDVPPMLQPLSERYQFVARRLPTAYAGTYVVYVLGFPLSEQNYVVTGSAAAPSLLQATHDAGRECMQSIAFLFDERISEAEPTFAPSPEFHLDMISRPQRSGLLRDWLFSRREPVPVAEGIPGEATFVEITPARLKGKLHVVKCEIAEALPLVFGKYEPYFGHVSQRDWIHPVT